MSTSHINPQQLTTLCTQAIEAAQEAFAEASGLQAVFAETILVPGAAIDPNENWVLVTFSVPGTETANCLAISAEFGAQLISEIVHSTVSEITPEVLQECTASLEALISGFITNLGASAANITLAFGQPQLPPDSLQIQTPVAIGGLAGTLFWHLSSQFAQQIAPVTVTANTEQKSPTATKLSNDLEPLLDIPLQVSVELGRVTLPLQDVLDLNSGSVVELEKAAGEPVDVLVNGRVLARGEVVVIDDNFGVRLTEIVSPRERVSKLGDAA